MLLGVRMLTEKTLNDKKQILLKALKNAVQNPLNVTNGELEYDWLAYYDSIHEACEVFERTKGDIVQINKIDDGFDFADGFYLLDLPNAQGSPIDGERVIASHDIFLMVKNIEADFNVGRLVGSHHSMIPLKKLYENKLRTIIIPFEVVSVIKPKQLGKFSLQYAYETAPLDEAFTHYITPASVMAIVLNKDVKQTIGFVVHARQLANVLGVENNKLNSLQYDTANALRMLKSRYNIEINESLITSISQFDSDIITIDGKAVIELHTQKN